MVSNQKNFVFGGNYFARGEFVLYINHSGKSVEINFNMKIPYSKFKQCSLIGRITVMLIYCFTLKVPIDAQAVVSVCPNRM